MDAGNGPFQSKRAQSLHTVFPAISLENNLQNAGGLFGLNCGPHDLIGRLPDEVCCRFRN